MELTRPFIKLPFRFDTDRLAAEVRQFDESKWMPHPSGMVGNSSLALISKNGGDNDEFSGHMLPTSHLEQSIYAKQVMASFGEVLSRSRYMRLAPGAEVSPHVDFNYHWYSRVRIHVPVITDPSVIFYCGDEQRHMKAGECWIFDSWRQHRVVNNWDQQRVHLVIDIAGSSRFWNTVRKSESLSDEAVQATAIDYIPDHSPQLRTEKFNVSPVMSPGEMDGIAKELIADFSANRDNDPRLVTRYREMLLDLTKDWRELWFQYGFQQPGFPHYSNLLQATKNQLEPNPRALVTSSNNVGVNPIIVQRILRAALQPNQRDHFIGD